MLCCVDFVCVRVPVARCLEAIHAEKGRLVTSGAATFTSELAMDLSVETTRAGYRHPVTLAFIVAVVTTIIHTHDAVVYDKRPIRNV